MRLIAHRGNINGPDKEKENSPEHIFNALNSGYDVEIDVWFIEGKFMLGHDDPQYSFPFTLLENYSNRLWIHCKNIPALLELNKIDKVGSKLNYFWHDSDRAVLTSKGYMWSIESIDTAILVMPESTGNTPLNSTAGICSDYVSKY
jgi:hypothetical protein